MRIHTTILALAETLFDEAEQLSPSEAATDALASAALTDMLARARRERRVARWTAVRRKSQAAARPVAVHPRPEDTSST